ncbi:MAG: c-type cytochrome biogenesis protein CcmI [Burkholderiaceae bacterium]
MNPIYLFLFVALFLCAIVVFVFWRVMSKASSVATEVNSKDGVMSNVAVFQEQLAELKKEYGQGTLSETEYELSHAELTERLMQDSQTHSEIKNASAPASSWIGLAWGFLILIPIASVGFYMLIGQPLTVDPQVVAAMQGDDQLTPERLQSMAQDLEKKLSAQPDNAEGWVMLARVQRASEAFDLADVAIQKALALTKTNDLLIERAEILAQKNSGQFEGEPWAIIRGVLQSEPNNGNALLLAGSASFAQGQYKDALSYWLRVQAILPADSPDAAPLANAIAQARQKLGAPIITTSKITGRVSIAKELLTQTSPQDTVFIYATAVEGSRMPLAVIKTTVAQLPYDFLLDDNSTMSPQFKLSSQSEVTVRARISKTGNAMPQPGDLTATASPVKVAQSPKLQLIISGP